MPAKVKPATAEPEVTRPTFGADGVVTQLLRADPVVAPTAEPGTSTSEFKVLAAVGVVIAAGVALFDTLAGTGLIHVDPAVVVDVNKFGAALESALATGYGAVRSIRKIGTQA